MTISSLTLLRIIQIDQQKGMQAIFSTFDRNQVSVGRRFKKTYSPIYLCLLKNSCGEFLLIFYSKNAVKSSVRFGETASL